jgi:hypothetical protein
MKSTQFRKYDNGSCELSSKIRISTSITTTMLIKEVAAQKFYWKKPENKITPKFIIKTIKQNILSDGLSHYYYHSDKEMEAILDLTIEAQYEKATGLTKKLFPSFFEITPHMRNKGVTSVALADY